MSDKPLCDRLAEALAAHHETTLALQELADELVEHCSRMRVLSHKICAVRQTLDNASGNGSEPMWLPRAVVPQARER